MFDPRINRQIPPILQLLRYLSQQGRGMRAMPMFGSALGRNSLTPPQGKPQGQAPMPQKSQGIGSVLRGFNTMPGNKMGQALTSSFVSPFMHGMTGNYPKRQGGSNV